MKLRQAKPGDAAAIARIWNREIRDGVSTFNSVEKPVEEVAGLIAARPGAWVVAELEGVVAGFATWAQFRGGVGYAHSFEHTVHLDAVARGRGVGRALMAAAEEGARQDGAHVLVAGISGENAAGIAFHEAMGFRHVGRMPEVGRKFGRWMDLILMQKML
ncbi:N-acetyltransferase family protein [Shimia sp. W99]